MSENINTITLNKDNKIAVALVDLVRNKEKLRYADYIRDNGVTLDTVPDHVQALANLANDIRKWEDGAERKAFCNKVRGGLKHHLAPKAEETAESEQVEAEQDQTDETATPAGDPNEVRFPTLTMTPRELEIVLSQLRAANGATLNDLADRIASAATV